MSGTEIDVVPFGSIEDAQGSIFVPPENTHKMNMSGFREACQHADIVIVQEKPEVQVPVVSPVGFALLKLIAWSDRPGKLRIKDARDFYYILQNYESIGNILELMYNLHEDILEQYDWDPSRASIFLFGRNVAEIASKNSKVLLIKLFSNQISSRDIEVFCSEMSKSGNNTVLMETFIRGFMESS